jgi:hypothetical protein
MHRRLVPKQTPEGVVLTNDAGKLCQRIAPGCRLALRRIQPEGGIRWGRGGRRFGSPAKLPLDVVKIDFEPPVSCVAHWHSTLWGR